MPDVLTCSSTTWRGAPAVSLANGRIEAVATARGGHLCSLRRSSLQWSSRPILRPMKKGCVKKRLLRRSTLKRLHVDELRRLNRSQLVALCRQSKKDGQQRLLHCQ